jgi:hypothetical protein
MGREMSMLASNRHACLLNTFPGFRFIGGSLAVATLTEPIQTPSSQSLERITASIIIELLVLAKKCRTHFEMIDASFKSSKNATPTKGILATSAFIIIFCVHLHYPMQQGKQY